MTISPSSGRLYDQSAAFVANERACKVPDQEISLTGVIVTLDPGQSQISGLLRLAFRFPACIPSWELLNH